MIAKVEGLNIHYVTEGHGPPCVIPSLAGSTFYERSFSPELRERLQLTFVELRGNRSDVGNIGDLTTAGLADSLAAFIDSVGIEEAVTIVH